MMSANVAGLITEILSANTQNSQFFLYLKKILAFVVVMLVISFLVALTTEKIFLEIDIPYLLKKLNYSGAHVTEEKLN